MNLLENKTLESLVSLENTQKTRIDLDGTRLWYINAHLMPAEHNTNEVAKEKNEKKPEGAKADSISS